VRGVYTFFGGHPLKSKKKDHETKNPVNTIGKKKFFGLVAHRSGPTAKGKGLISKTSPGFGKGQAAEGTSRGGQEKRGMRVDTRQIRAITI